jgi:predicted enzyme related to lactoylglutathione lyase
MPEFSSYPAGTPSWVDLASPDVDASKAFYGALFGWGAETAEDPAAGGYTMFTLRGKYVAGLAPIMNEGQPPAWATYISVDDADKTAELVAPAGGTIVMEPFDVLTVGRMAVLQDPTGAFLCLWQAGDHAGAQLANEPGAFCWNELDTRDVAKAKQFYADVFGWSAAGGTEGPMEYYEFKVGDRTVAGMMPMPPMVPAQVPAYWLSYFAVEDTDATVAEVTKRGGQVLMAPMDIPAGRFAVVTGPHGESFAVIKLPA